MGAAHEAVVVLEDVVARVEDEQDEVGAVLPPLALPEEQLAVGAVAGNAGVENLDPAAEALLEELRERLVLLHLDALGEGIAEDEDAEPALGLVGDVAVAQPRSEEHTSELQSHSDLVCRLLLEKKKK